VSLVAIIVGIRNIRLGLGDAGYCELGIVSNPFPRAVLPRPFFTNTNVLGV
jgi:hypothetical protein